MADASRVDVETVRAEHPASRLSHGRALAADTEIVRMDEHFSALDPLIRAEMQDQLLQLQSTLRKTIVFITHDIAEALRLGQRVGATVQPMRRIGKDGAERLVSSGQFDAKQVPLM